MMSLKEKDYKKYLCQAYYIKTGQKLNLWHPKTLNEKIQWLKLYDNLPIKTTLTDKVLVRDWVKEKIGEEYLKPVLQICNNFDEIDFDKLPDSFIIKCNHGCKWHTIIKNKTKFLENKNLIKLTKNEFKYWMTQTFFGFSDFETQYKNIKPQIIIESLLREKNNQEPEEIDIYCFNSKPKIINIHKFDSEHNYKLVSSFDENYNSINLRFNYREQLINREINNNYRKAFDLSKKLAKGFKFVRVDFIQYNNNLYFGEMTFTPQSGFIDFSRENGYWNKELGNLLNLKGD